MKLLKTIKSRYALAATSVYLALMPLVSSADCAEGELCNPIKDGMGLWKLIEYIIRDVVVAIVAPIAIVLALLWSGFMFIQAQGNEAKLVNARNNFLYVVVGAVLLVGAYVILEVLTSTIGELLNN